MKNRIFLIVFSILVTTNIIAEKGGRGGRSSYANGQIGKYQGNPRFEQLGQVSDRESIIPGHLTFNRKSLAQMAVCGLLLTTILQVPYVDAKSVNAESYTTGPLTRACLEAKHNYDTSCGAHLECSSTAENSYASTGNPAANSYLRQSLLNVTKENCKQCDQVQKQVELCFDSVPSRACTQRDSSETLCFDKNSTSSNTQDSRSLVEARHARVSQLSELTYKSNGNFWTDGKCYQENSVCRERSKYGICALNDHILGCETNNLDGCRESVQECVCTNTGKTGRCGSKSTDFVGYTPYYCDCSSAQTTKPHGILVVGSALAIPLLTKYLFG